MTTSTEEQLQKVWDEFIALVNKIDDDRRECVMALCDYFCTRLVVCPSDPRLDSPGCKPGGLLQQALAVTKMMKRLNAGMKFGVDESTILVVGLLHEVGKVGDLEKDLFVPETDTWRVQKLGAVYRVDESLLGLSVSERSLFLCQNFGIRLSENEWRAIRGPARHGSWVEDRLAPTSEPAVSILLKASRDLCVRVKNSDS